MATLRLSRVLAYGWVVVLSALLLGPALGTGFVLSYDLVFTPRQDLLPGSIGLGGGLPRAVPQDALVALAETVVPGSLVEKVILLAIPVVAGTGMLRLLPGTKAGVVAATLAIANPFVAQRLVIGHWGFLLAYALVPWALIVARRLRATGDLGDGLRLVLIMAAGSWTPSGSVLITAMALPPVLLPGAAYRRRHGLLLVAAASLTWIPWVLPALLHPGGTAGDPQGTRIFALRPDSPGGVLVSGLTGGGIWNSEVVLASRGSALTWILVVALLGLAAWGLPALVDALGRGLVAWWGGLAIVGLVAALSSALMLDAWSSLVDSIPGGGLARDAHKLLAPWMLLAAASAGMGAARLADVSRDRAARIAVTGALIVVPLACQPDLWWGASGRLAAVEYPEEWTLMREALVAESAPGDVVSLPWTAFRRFEWNAGRTVLDPAPRWLPRTTVVSDTLEVQTRTGIVEVSGDDPRAQVITEALATPGYPIDALLLELGIGWALVARDQPGPIPDLVGWRRVAEGPTLTLYQAPGNVSPVPAGPVALVGAVDAALLTSAVAGAILLGVGRIRRVRAPQAGPLIR